MGRCTLKAYKVNPEVFDNILETFDKYVKTTDDLKSYYKGYKNKQDIMFDGVEYLICRDICLNYFCPEIPRTTWKQVIVRKDESLQIPCIEDITGDRAWAYMLKMLKNYYTFEELEEVFHAHEAEYDKDLIQAHYLTFIYPYECVELENCYKYDINGAHADALLEMLPKASEFILKLYNERKEHPVNKMYLNYFVGMIKHKGYDKTYNWVVQRTTRNLLSAINYCNGRIVYANTDGFIIQQPENLIEDSRELGKFKKEYEGTVYAYRDKNYWVVQAGDKITGSIMYKVRKQFDLRQLKVVHYDKVVHNHIYECNNIEIEVLKETYNESC